MKRAIRENPISFLNTLLVMLLAALVGRDIYVNDQWQFRQDTLIQQLITDMSRIDTTQKNVLVRLDRIENKAVMTK